jgi:hypothetical protein
MKEEENNKGYSKQPEQKITVVGYYLSRIILNVNALSTPIRRYGLAEWITQTNQDPTIHQ